MHNYRKLLVIFFMIYSFGAVASALLSGQIEQSSGFVEGHVANIDEGQLVISPVKWLGVELSFEGDVKISTKKELSLGVGEHVLIILDNHMGTHTLYDQELSIYSVRRIGTKKILVNKSKDLNPLEGQYRADQFYKLTEKIKLQKISKAQINYKNMLAKKRLELRHRTRGRHSGRKIASIETRPVGQESKNNIIWTLLLMCFIATLVRKLHKHL